jgi:hypothetical protein
VTAGRLRAIKTWLVLGQHRKDPQSEDLVGYLVGEILEIDVSVKANKPRVVTMLETWVKSGSLREYNANDKYRSPKGIIGVP